MRLGDRNFFNLFLGLASRTNPKRDCDEWEVAGVGWRRQRHVLWGSVSYQLEIYELERKGRGAWKLLFVREMWWSSDRREAIRDGCWTHLESGSRRDVLAWFAEREREQAGDAGRT